MSEEKLQVISIEVEDTPGVMTRISSLFSRRGFNIKNLSVGHTHDPGISRFTIATYGDDKMMEQIRKHCQKLINVLKTENLGNQDSILREFTIIKLLLDDVSKDKINYLVDFYGGRMLYMSKNMVIVEFSGSEEKIDIIYQKLPPDKILESIRTGKVGISKADKLKK